MDAEEKRQVEDAAYSILLGALSNRMQERIIAARCARAMEPFFREFERGVVARWLDEMAEQEKRKDVAGALRRKASEIKRGRHHEPREVVDTASGE